ncbi:hypothetical protein, partial [Campylobacter coli]|uniref:hypothetical protein n=1 Tax=Campylobacter coli TaxID=195 RepID=UPI003F7C7A62
MTAMSTLVPALQRELAVPGTFEDVFPDTDETMLTDLLADGFAEAQLNGFFPTISMAVDEDLEPPSWATTPDLS